MSGRTMNALVALKTGLSGALSRKRAVALYWVAHTLLALSAAIPLAGMGISLVAKTKYGDELLRDFDVMFFFEAAQAAGRPEWTLFLTVPLLVLLFVIAIFLAGGAFHTLRRTETAYSPALFWEGAGLYFWRFLRISLYSALAWLPFVLIQAVVTRSVKEIWGEGMAEGPVHIAGQVKSIVLLLCAGYAVTVVDFTRARVAASGSTDVFKTLLRTMRFVLRRPFLTLCPWTLLAVMLALCTWLYLKFAAILPPGVMPLVILLIIVQQAYVLLRVLLRFTGWGAVIAIDAAVRGDHHEPEQAVFSYVDRDGGGDGSLRTAAEADPEAESPQAG